MHGMAWIESLLDRLAEPQAWGYTPGGAWASETLSLVALAMQAHGRHGTALQAAEALVGMQQGDGSLPPLAGETEPGWPTAWGVLAWMAVGAEQSAPSDSPLARARRRAIDWMLAMHGTAIERNTDHVAHDTTLIGWPWVAGTHSWIEPTAACLLALRGAGLAGHPRAREAVELLVDRLLPGGGCNYGNTVVLGQTLRPHLQPSGLVLLALAGTADRDRRLARTVGYVRRSARPTTTAASLSYALMGLAAHGVLPDEAESWLEQAAERTQRQGAMQPRLALCALAASGGSNPLVQIARGTIRLEVAPR
jgi:hypothetical protein